MSVRRLSLAALCAVLMTGPVLAHAKLVSSVPPADAQATGMPATMTLTFSEPLEAAFSKVALTGPRQAVVSGASLKVDPADGTRLVVSLPAGLPSGAYAVDWIAVATDGHKTSGHYSFTAK